MKHDPSRHVGYLQQCLSQDKRSIGVMISAGCPLAVRVPTGTGTATEPLIPDVQGLTDLVSTELKAGALRAAFEKVEQHLADDGHTAINIETHLSFIRGLLQIAGSGTVRDLTPDELKELEQTICKSIGERVSRDLPTTPNPYVELAAWIGSTLRSAPVELFSTNYDLLLEQALERSRIPYFDGFSGSNEAFLDSHSIDHNELPARWTRLWKLHGSINWTLNSRNQVCRTTTSTSNCIIHPSHLKYDESRRMPYLVMIDRLRSFIRAPSSVLVTCGYSFRDEHLNACLLEGLTGSPRSAVFGLLYGKLADHPEAVDLARSAGNLSLLAYDGAVVGTQESEWDNRDLTDTGIWSGAVEVKDDPANPGTNIATFRLGDFAQLGKFLLALIGTTSAGGNNVS